jgi:hypothetical protein
MAVFRGRQACCNAFRFDIVGYFRTASNDSFLTHFESCTQESINHLLGVCRAFHTRHSLVDLVAAFGVCRQDVAQSHPYRFGYQS